MARYKPYNLKQDKWIPLSYGDQMVPGSFEYALDDIVEKHLDLSVFEPRYRNDETGPDIHIFTASKQPWVVLPPGTPAVLEYYDRKQYWPAESLARREALLLKIAAQQSHAQQ